MATRGRLWTSPRVRKARWCLETAGRCGSEATPVGTVGAHGLHLEPLDLLRGRFKAPHLPAPGDSLSEALTFQKGTSWGGRKKFARRLTFAFKKPPLERFPSSPPKSEKRRPQFSPGLIVGIVASIGHPIRKQRRVWPLLENNLKYISFQRRDLLGRGALRGDPDARGSPGPGRFPSRGCAGKG